MKVERDSDLLWLEADAVRSDYEEFLRDPSARTSARLDQGVAILPDYCTDFSAPFAEWVDGYRSELEARIRHQLTADLSLHRARSDWISVSAAARACLTLDPLNETATLHLAESLAHAGLKAKAVQLLDSYARDTGRHSCDIALPATILRKRIHTLGDVRSGALGRGSLLGRGEDIVALEREWSAAREGGRRLAHIRGESGSGKSRLLEEFVTRASLSGRCASVVVQAVNLQAAQPFALLSAIVPRLLCLPGAAGCSPSSMPFLRRLEAPVSGSHIWHRDSDEISSVRLSIERAVVDLLTAVSEDQPILLGIDDIDCADDASLSALGRFFKEVSDGRLFMLLVGHSARLTIAVPSCDITLGRLADSEMRSLATGYLATLDETRRRSAIEWCIAASAGNPGFLEVLARHCITTPDDRTVPSGIVDAIAMRISALEPAVGSVLAALCILQEPCPPSVLAAMLELPVPELLFALEVLDRAGLVHSECGHLQPRSKVVVDEVRARVPASILPFLHLRAATVLTRDVPTRHQLWNISTHWRAAGETSKAREAMRGCWLDAVQVGHLSVAQEIIGACLSEDCDTQEVRAELLDALIEVSGSTGDSSAQEDALAVRLSLPDELTPPARRAALEFERTQNRIINSFGDPGPHQQALCAHLGSSLLDDERRLQAASLLMMLADSSLDVALADRTYSSMRNLRIADSNARTLYDRSSAIYHSTFGDLDLAQACAERILAADDGPLRTAVLRPAGSAALAFHIVGKQREAMLLLTRSHEAAIAAGIFRRALHSAATLASFSFDYGDVQSAQSWLDSADESYRETGGDVPCDLLSVRADMSLLKGDWKQARMAVEQMATTGIYSAPRFEHALLTYRLRVSLAESSASPNRAHVDQLLAWHNKARAFGRHDDEMQVLTLALCRTGQQRLSARLLSDYLRQARRERRPISYLLSRQVTELGLNAK